jgi:hypothetical protein
MVARFMDFKVKGSYEKGRANGVELDELKQIDLVAFVERYGYRMDTRKSSKAAGADKVMRREADDDKLLVKETPDGSWAWCSCRDWNERGSIVDFVRREEGCGFVEAVQWLRGQACTNHFPSHKSRSKACEPASQGQADGFRKKVCAVWCAAKWEPEPAYLLSRGLSPATLGDPRFVDTFRVDRSGNVIFPHRDRIGMCGYELRREGFKSFGAGTHKGLWFSKNLSEAKSLLLCEAPINCMSHYQIHGGDSAYVGTGGTPSASQRDLLTGLLAKAADRGVSVYSAFDNDEAGDKYAEMIQLFSPDRIERLTPFDNDWNEDLIAVIQETL